MLMRPLNSRYGNHVDVEQGLVCRCALIGKYSVHDDDAGMGWEHGRDDLEQYLPARGVGPVVEDVSEEVGVCA